MLKTMVIFIFLKNAYIYFKKTFFSGRCIFFILATTLVTLLELIFGVVFGPIFAGLFLRLWSRASLIYCDLGGFRVWLKKTVKKVERRRSFVRSSV